MTGSHLDTQPLLFRKGHVCSHIGPKFVAVMNGRGDKLTITDVKPPGLVHRYLLIPRCLDRPDSTSYILRHWASDVPSQLEGSLSRA